MRKLTLLPLLLLVPACQESALVQPEDDADLIVAQASRNPTNPFVGSWWGIDWEDGSLHRVSISQENALGDIQVEFRDDAQSICDGEPGRFHATGRIVAENVLKIFDLVAICQGPEGDEIPFGSIVGYEYVPATDVLRYCLVLETTPEFCAMNLERGRPEN